MEKHVVILGHGMNSELHKLVMEEILRQTKSEPEQPKTNLENLADTIEAATTEEFTVFKNGEKGSESYVVVEHKSRLAFNVGVRNDHVYGCSCNEKFGMICKHMVHVSITQRLNLEDLPK